jgi:hypothetical protein
MVPGWLVCLVVAGFYVDLTAVGARRIYPLGDDEARQAMEDPDE